MISDSECFIQGQVVGVLILSISGQNLDFKEGNILHCHMCRNKFASGSRESFAGGRAGRGRRREAEL